VLGIGRTLFGLMLRTLLADTVLIYLAFPKGHSAASFHPSGLDGVYAALPNPPFLVGTAYICHALLGGHRTESSQHRAV
jgi:hypothetical protein